MKVQRLRLLMLLVLFVFISTIPWISSSGDMNRDSKKYLCERVAKGNKVTYRGTRAEYFDGKHTWTIFGVTQKEAEPIIKPENWSVGSAPYQILIVKEPISDTPILPFSNPVPNTVNHDFLGFSAWRGEYESASFVLRSGERPLEHVQIEVTDLLHTDGAGRIGRANVDARLVKCWYQAGLSLRRNKGDKKRLTPELLLHDADLVRVDYENKVNLVRDIANLQDAKALLPFDVPARTNQQLWFTFQVPKDCKSGRYNGKIQLGFMVGGRKMMAILPVSLEVDQRVIPDPPIEYALFYMARFEPLNKGLLAREKTEQQLEAEFRDMRAHGLTNVALDYEYRKDKSGEPDFSRLKPVLEAMRRAGFNTKRLLFVDWKLGGSQDEAEYSRKMLALKRLAEGQGFTEVFVYNKDEQDYSGLVSNRKTFEIPHQLGMKNFVACSLKTASSMEGLLDVAIIPGKYRVKSTFCEGDNTPTCVNVTPWAYTTPQAGMETPGTYRTNYGLSLIENGYRGVCNYVYQSGDCWDDWAEVNWRPHVMAYPNLKEPIPTLQWEGFREAIDDVRKHSMLGRR